LTNFLFLLSSHDCYVIVTPLLELHRGTRPLIRNILDVTSVALTKIYREECITYTFAEGSNVK